MLYGQNTKDRNFLLKTYYFQYIFLKTLYFHSMYKKQKKAVISANSKPKPVLKQYI